jgi:hypothetical protein
MFRQKFQGNASYFRALEDNESKGKKCKADISKGKARSGKACKDNACNGEACKDNAYKDNALKIIMCAWNPWCHHLSSELSKGFEI